MLKPNFELYNHLFLQTNPQIITYEAIVFEDLYSSHFSPHFGKKKPLKPINSNTQTKTILRFSRKNEKKFQIEIKDLSIYSKFSLLENSKKRKKGAFPQMSLENMNQSFSRELQNNKTINQNLQATMYISNNSNHSLFSDVLVYFKGFFEYNFNKIK